MASEKNILTSSQQRAVAARGNVLVMAGAGTGKTHTLVARCLNLICEENVSLDEILIVTFTEAAATEMKQRLRNALEKNLREKSDAHFAEQLALFDAAHIGTLHSFCFKLVREHFHELGLDPQISILDEGQTRLLADEMLEEIFNAHYEGEDEFSLAVQNLIKIYGDGRDEKIRALTWRLHNYIQTRADAGKWPAQQIENFSLAEPVQWRRWLGEAISNWKNEWLPFLKNLRGENPKAAELAKVLENCDSTGVLPVKSGVAPDFLSQIISADDHWPRGTKKFREPLEKFFDDAKFLNSLLATEKSNPLTEDWNWICSHMKSLLQLAREFSEKFSERKRADAVLDFHDLEQFSLKLLWNFETEKPTEIAKRWREKLRYVFVDEYQDINAAQDKIISALSRDGENANRFLVGDVKQSIYRFRLADPKIFRDYAHNWRGKNGQTIPLTENFRSRNPILNLVNSLFEPLMREEIGGVNYDDEAKLKFGERINEICDNPDSNGGRAQAPELLLRFSKTRNGISENENGNDEIAGLEESEKEARMLGLRLLELKKTGRDWRDMTILLRSSANKAEIFAKQFEQLKIPLLITRGGFYDSSEISDLLCLLQLLDNPLQDVPLIAVLRSPVVGMSLDELAEIRLLHGGKFWFALNQVQSPKVFADGHQAKNETRAKVEKFLKRFSRWRKLAQQSSLSQCLEQILDETHYADWLKAQSRGTQRFANVQRFLHLAEKFDEFQRQGLFCFLKFIEAQREIEAEPEVAPVAEENAVRLMSIHQSKGLEFPIVALADLGKNFNEQDLRGEIILDEQFGLCPRVKPPDAGGRYSSLSYWLAQKNQKRELRGEEMRLLYVALTRARDHLILCGSISAKKWENFFENNSMSSEREILSARCFLDWLAIWFKVQGSAFNAENAMQGELSHLRWRVLTDEELTVEKVESEKRETETKPAALDKTAESKIRSALDWQYKFVTATQRAAKSSVTILRRQAEELDEESKPIFHFQNRSSLKFKAQKLSAADAGTAAHTFLQHFDFETAGDLKLLEAEAGRLAKENYLAAEEVQLLELKNILGFWNSEAGKKIISKKEFVRRELPFTAKFSPAELDEILGTKSADLENEFVVVQGIADLAVILPEEIWIVDFKTDNVSANEIEAKIKFYAPQLRLYARALEKIYARPVKNCWLHFLAKNRTEKV